MATVGLVFSVPLWLLIAVAIVLDDGHPIFYLQERVGRHGRRFRTWKFRSMVRGVHKRTERLRASTGHSRATRVGRFLRATALDELPQFWNIMRGDMSFVGPRALMPEETEVHGSGDLVALEKLPGFQERHTVRPGLTGLAQVYASRDIPRRQKFRYDLLYIRKQSLSLDLRLLAYTLWIVLRGRCEYRRGKSR
ncbi:MAG: sugar transferase [Candidatus Rokubacteria bacterium]|nr:sugar transferase [Candidatus Rokubacteria bacterium]